MKILIIGHSVVDTINYKGKQVVKPGGIYYSAVTFTSFALKEDKIFLCTSVDNENMSLFSNTYNLVENDFITTVQKIPRVNLQIHHRIERCEHYENITEKLNTELKFLESPDGILINMITGFDITLEQLQKIRDKFSCPIYFDVHTFSRGLDESGRREFRVIPQFEEWAKFIDIIQVNETELGTLFKNLEEKKTIDKLTKLGVRQILITKAERGVKVFWLDRNEIHSHDEEGIKVKSVNKIGCGDVFGGVYFYNYIRYNNIMKALKLANIAGGLSATYTQESDFLKLKKDVYERLSEA